MGLETGNFISDLVATNPLGSDLASTVDDHIRLLKTTIKGTFPNINAAVSATDEELSLLAGKTGTVWTSANDGSGSGLDADLVKGVAVAPANSTGTVTLSAANGSNATYSRSDHGHALDQSIAPTWTATHSFTKTSGGSGAAIFLNAAAPFLTWNQSTAAADNKRWQMGVSAEQFLFQTLTDADGSATNIFTVDRTGTTIDRVAFPTDSAGANVQIGTIGSVILGAARLNVRTTANAAAAAFASSTSGTGTVEVHNEGTSGNNVFINFNTEASASPSFRGNITYNRGGGLVAYNTSSDARLKTNIADAPSVRDLIDFLRVRSFDWIESGNHVEFGFIAQELDAVAPIAVSRGEVWQVDYSKVTPMLWKGLQEAYEQIDELRNDLSLHKRRVAKALATLLED